MKAKSHYICQSCGFTSARWLGRCPGCEAWSSMIEERTGGEEDLRSLRPGAPDAPSLHGPPGAGDSSEWVFLDAEETGGSKPQRRISTGMGELDRALGGGMVPDSFILLGGDPGIGKSTLLLQMAKGLRERNPELKILYVSGEESVDQIRGRAHRLGVVGRQYILLSAETRLEQVFASVKEVRPHVLIMDSLQTFSSDALESAPGSVSQVREISTRLMGLAKSAGIAVWLVGHVTKEGNIAGPKMVEHMVDTVLYFESEGGQSYRLLRTVKNRFGSTRELGVFEMEGEGLREVSNPSSLFLSDRREPVPGTAISAALEGSRPILVELQALVTSTTLAVPRRTAVGMDSARVALLAAILEKHMRLPLAEEDLFFNVAGGLRLSEPACDLAAAAAIWSSHEERAIPAGWVFLGEVGLTGEVRRISQEEIRIAEARKLGFTTLVVPRSNHDREAARTAKAAQGLTLAPISSVVELPDLLP